MALSDAPILVVHHDDTTAVAIVKAITDAQGDVVFATHGHEAIQRLNQFQFDAAVIDGRADVVAAALKERNIPFCTCADEEHVGRVVATLAALLDPRE